MRVVPIAALIVALGALAALPTIDTAFAQAKQAPAKAEAPPPLKQMALRQAQIDSFLTAQAEIDAATSKLPPGDPNKPDPKIQAQVEGIVKKNGFSGLPEYGDVFGNIALVMSGIDQKSKAFTDPPEAIARDIKLVESDKRMPAKDKAAALAELKAAQATVQKVQFTENVALITKNYDKLQPIFAHEEEEAPPPAKGAPAKKK